MAKDNITQVKTVDSKCFSLAQLFAEKYTVDFYQREYVWEKKQLEDLINDLSSSFLKCWKSGDSTSNVRSYDPYFMGEVVISLKTDEPSAIIDGQQRITTFTLLLIYMLHTFKHVAGFPTGDIERAIYSSDYGVPRFNLDIDVRRNCMLGLFNNSTYNPVEEDKQHVQKIVDRYNDIAECWNDKIDDSNIASFAYWILGKIVFSKVWTNSDDFAYVIFETMNDRGLSLTHVEMLRSYLLANIDAGKRDYCLAKFDKMIGKLSLIKLTSKSKAEQEFFKVYLRGHYAEDLSQGNDLSDFVRIGNAFHRWVRDNESLLSLSSSNDYVEFLNKIVYFADKYGKIYTYIASRDASKYFYLIVNSDYGFTLQTPLILAAIKYNDSDTVVEEKIQLVSKYITKVLTWRVWNHWMISQSSLEAPIYDLCKKIRDLDVDGIKALLATDPINLPALNNSPTLNQQNKRRIKVLLSLITEIVARESNESDYILNKSDIEVEHIWSDHFDQHTDEFATKDEFDNVRNNIGDLLVLPKSFNASYNDAIYSIKVQQYFSQNILAQTLNEKKYTNNPGFIKFKNTSGLDFKSYTEFKRLSVSERADLYKAILEWNWK
ncbi:MAG: DUF262 domain-containing protein [Anaeroplasma sp.]|nr:DUF262 domain-containing protein [Anaeroplasma sp.]